MAMRRFQRSLPKAIRYAERGGQAIYLHRVLLDHEHEAFLAAYASDEYIGSLFDRDERRLFATARRLGIRKATIYRRGTPGQHIRVCGDPLAYALMACDNAD